MPLIILQQLKEGYLIMFDMKTSSSNEYFYIVVFLLKIRILIPPPLHLLQTASETFSHSPSLHPHISFPTSVQILEITAS